MRTLWYLWAIDDDPTTNRYLVQIIGEQCAAEEMCRGKLCADGQRRNLFRCPQGYANVRSAVAGITDVNLKIWVFRESIEGQVVRYDLWRKSVRKASRQGSYGRKVRRAS